MKHVDVGSIVTLDIGGHGILYTYEIVHEGQENPVLGKISPSSHLAYALMGRRTGERLVLEMPSEHRVTVVIQEIQNRSHHESAIR
ncbi:MAG: GreA/GreB family elongation factor [Candidatus Kerfeldbacteria bacterium]|nr:GreA/GreB family elongation factor [Candidatus Kerfeldbacteria bacterium]